MKTEKYNLINLQVLGTLIERLKTIKLDGKTTVTISATGTKSANQRAYQWLLYTVISNSGRGGKHESTKDSVHLKCKYLFALPILMRDDPFFMEIYEAWKEKYKDDETRMHWFVQTQVSTEQLNVTQMAEYLTEVINYYSRHIDLPYPEDRGLLE